MHYRQLNECFFIFGRSGPVLINIMPNNLLLFVYLMRVEQKQITRGRRN